MRTGGGVEKLPQANEGGGQGMYLRLVVSESNFNQPD